RTHARTPVPRRCCLTSARGDPTMINRMFLKTASLAVLACTFAMSGWSTQAHSQLPARVFTVGTNNQIHLATGGAFWCVHVEPINNDFQVTDINACTVVLICNGGGSASQLAYNCTKTTVVGDGDGNGIQDIEFCFPKVDMQPLFDNLHGRKPKTVTLGVNGNLVTGGSFTGGITLQLYLMD